MFVESNCVHTVPPLPLLLLPPRWKSHADDEKPPKVTFFITKKESFKQAEGRVPSVFTRPFDSCESTVALCLDGIFKLAESEYVVLLFLMQHLIKM